MKKHTLTFDQAGNIRVDATGFKGKSCAEVTKKLLAGLDAATKEEHKKPEYNMLDTEASKQVAPSKW